jgi:two-component system LytT family response regulator
VKELRVLVVDDEPLARRRVRALLRRRPEVGLVVEAADGDEALQRLRQGGVDLVFLDVQMPGTGGLDVARALAAEGMPPLVFVTAHAAHATAAFDVAAVDYLLKPFDDERFTTAFERAVHRLRQGSFDGATERLRALVATLERQRAGAPEVVAVEKGERVLLLPVAEIEWLRSAGNYVEVHARGEVFLVRATLATVAARLAAARFLRIHRSVLVNALRVAEIRADRGEHRVVLVDGTVLPLSRRYRRLLPSL